MFSSFKLRIFIHDEIDTLYSLIVQYTSPKRNGYCRRKDSKVMHRNCRCENTGDKEDFCKIKCNNDVHCKGYSYSNDKNECQFYTTSQCQKPCILTNNYSVGSISQWDQHSYSGCSIKHIGMHYCAHMYEKYQIFSTIRF